MEQKKRIRVVVASPSDVQIERDLLPDVLDELNHGIGELSNLYFELYRWETEAYPGFHPHGPQGLIDSVLRIEECDILIVIFWKRFGTLVEDGQTGTEHEFRIAYNAWEKKGRPQIMVYFNKKLYRINTSSEMHQLEALLNFKNNFPKKGLWWDYEGADEFKDLVRKHLTQFVKYLSPTFAPFMAPPDLPQFTAREKELYQLKQKLQDKVGSLVVLCSLTGYGGVGKSALAAHFANKFCSIFPDGIFGLA